MLSYAKCADFASDYCPCKLAECNQCPVCTQCGGKMFCDCSNTTGFCVSQELKSRGGKARPLRSVYTGCVKKVIPFGDTVLIRVEMPPDVVNALRRPGAFVFMRRNENAFYDTPLSVLFSEIDSNTIGVVVIPKGVKTSDLAALREKDRVFVRGPFFSGILGLNDVFRLRHSSAAVFMRGIGFLPSLGVIDALRHQDNKFTLYLDEANFNSRILRFFERFFEWKTVPCAIAGTGDLSEEARTRIQEELSNGTELIHFGASDYLTNACVAFLRSIQRTDVKFSCCNNSKMCCGEGICGACASDSEKRTFHLCKEQINPYEYFGRLK